MNLVFLGIILTSASYGVDATCWINTTILSDLNSPFVMSLPDFQLKYSSSKDLVSVERGEGIALGCPGGVLDYNNLPVLFLDCGNDDFFLSEGKVFIRLYSAKCIYKEKWGHVINTGEQCGVTGEKLIIGAELEANYYFVPFLTVCFDKELLRTTYTHKTLHFIKKPNGAHAVHTFNNDDNITHFLHGPIGQRKARQRINQLLGLPLQSEKVSSSKFNLQLRRLTEENEFEHKFSDSATYRYLNTFYSWHDATDKCWQSDWKLFNRHFVGPLLEKLKRPLDVYTGVHGILTLPHERTKRPIPLYLYEVERKKAGPVASVIWKVIFDPATKKAVVILRNNEHTERIRDPYMCRPINRLIKWINFKCPFYYACDYVDAKLAIPEIPDLDVEDLLSD